ncbi:ubiquinol-cytochrome C chaperone-domain-containing protein [Annulohypoxylon maeteangense]|uniref:ubiquinol-cytochrome C chaperone-domain-containing protein n=1 Tax=Annulohypoxylon maeteangense TaxID=1927788 RepID=UPI00200794F4|nr:ubiquinol-cytochrome C chaperone-domain-containing protein [Annulohypoxylon maeteangense]KAI0883608.1 ubiquinol-cytochrome C chaperone-domain-containing protein [Annulohypoxylon maeteangense]
MACRSCRRQLALLMRQTTTATEFQNVAILRQFVATRPPRLDQRRNFGSTPRQLGVRDIIAQVFKNSAEPYRVVQATEHIYKACAREASYTISAKDRTAGTIPKTAEGEDLGEGTTMWHNEFKLPPTFSTWSQVTMLHMYLIFARLRDLDREVARSWQRQLIDHYFFDAEEKMDLVHGISSRGLRHRYLKDLFIQWRGIIAAYDEGVVKGDSVLASAVWRNVYKARDDVDVRALAAIVSWMRLCLKMLDQIPDESLYFQTESVFKWPAKNEFMLVDKPVRELEDALQPTVTSAPAKAPVKVAAKATA